MILSFGEKPTWYINRSARHKEGGIDARLIQTNHSAPYGRNPFGIDPDIQMTGKPPTMASSES